ncbi:uncharacterized protein LOC126884181 [Diabrotica virgifera virgifera]|uniref:HTH CENPB-type domain-containing protein n=1 Tax=Diabrotica virgifera virgifera TaxID=50390 RepID=A0ABM5K724_DIAVI|nr:uncharacterized protein LOC126884181 [Diabrotica virgifera virgifera]
MPRKRAQWSEEDLRSALQAIADGMSIKGAAKSYNIPRSTLGLHHRTQNPVKKLGRSPVLSAAQENDLVEKIYRLAEVGMPITSKVLMKSVFSFAITNRIPNPFSKESNKAGRKWLKLFLCRHPEVARRKAQQMNMARAQKMNKTIVDDYFHKLRDTIEKLNLFDKPGSIYNIDEKGCRLTIHKQQIVFARKGAKRVHLTAPEHGENVSIVGCGNALGQAIPPFVLFKGQRFKPEWSDHLPPGSKAIVTNKGSMTCEAFISWLDHFSSFKNPGPTLLIFDGAKCHLDISIVEAANRMDITLFCLPSNTSHELQPMDKSVFKSFETFWDQEVLQFLTTNPGMAITKMRFGHIFTPVWLKAMTPSNIISGFAATGIYPFRPDAIPEAAFAPSLITHREEDIVNHSTSQDLADVVRSSSKSIEPTDKNEASTSGYKVPEKTNNKKKNHREEDIVNHSTCQDLSDVVRSSSKSIEPADKNEASTSGYKVLEKTNNKKKKRLISVSSSESLSDFSLHDDSLDDVSSEDEPMKRSKRSSSSEDGSPLRELKYKQTGNTVTKETKKYVPGSNQVTTSDSKCLNSSFKDTGLLITPEIKLPTVKRKPALNSKAQQVTKDLFAPKSKLVNPVKVVKKTTSGVPKISRKEESWFCFLCKVCSKEDMRLCIVCCRYVHEACVGLTKDDKENFICPQCS